MTFNMRITFEYRSIPVEVSCENINLKEDLTEDLIHIVRKVVLAIDGMHKGDILKT